MTLAPETVAAQLADATTRNATVAALETALAASGSGSGGDDMPLRCAAAAALTSSMLNLTDAEAFRRMGVLVLAIITEAEDATAAWGAAGGDGRFATLLAAAENAVGEVARKSPQELTRDDALTYAAARGYHHTGVWHPDLDTALEAAGTDMLTILQAIEAEPMHPKTYGRFSEKSVGATSCAYQNRMAELCLELLGQPEQLGKFVCPGLWCLVSYCMMERPSVGLHALDRGLFDCIARGLHTAGEPADWMSRSRGRASSWIATTIFEKLWFALYRQGDDVVRVGIKKYCVTSGLFGYLIHCLQAAETIGIYKAVDDIHPSPLFFVLALLRYICGCGRDTPEYLVQLRSLASTLQYFCSNSLPMSLTMGYTTGVEACKLLVTVFGRDESDSSSKFTFTYSIIDDM